MADMELPNFIHDLVNAAIYAGIATKDPTTKNRVQALQATDELKRRVCPYISGKEKFKKQMPFYAEMMEGGEDGAPRDAETIRHALREVGVCGLEHLYNQLVPEQVKAGYWKKEAIYYMPTLEGPD